MIVTICYLPCTFHCSLFICGTSEIFALYIKMYHKNVFVLNNYFPKNYDLEDVHILSNSKYT